MGNLVAEVKSMFPFGTRGRILQVELHENGSLRVSCLNTLSFGKQFKEKGLTVKVGEEEHRLWASPSKPVSVTAQDRETTNAVMTRRRVPIGFWQAFFFLRSGGSKMSIWRHYALSVRCARCSAHLG